MWLFTLNAHDALAGAHKFSVGIPLVAAAAYLVLFTARQIYLDFAELQRNMTDADQDCRDAEPTSADLTPGPDGDGVDDGARDGSGAVDLEAGSVARAPEPSLAQAADDDELDRSREEKTEDEQAPMPTPQQQSADDEHEPVQPETSAAGEPASTVPSSVPSADAEPVSTAPSSAPSANAEPVSTAPSNAPSADAEPVSTVPSSAASADAEDVSTAPSSEPSADAERVSTAPPSASTEGAEPASTAPSSAPTADVEHVSTDGAPAELGADDTLGLESHTPDRAAAGPEQPEEAAVESNAPAEPEQPAEMTAEAEAPALPSTAPSVGALAGVARIAAKAKARKRSRRTRLRQPDAAPPITSGSVPSELGQSADEPTPPVPITDADEEVISLEV